MLVRAEDTVARLGGDEFVIVLEEIAQPKDAAVLAEKIVAALRHPILLNDKEVVASVSIGISVYPDHGESGDDLRVTVELILRKLAEGATEADLLDGCPQLKKEDIQAAMG